MCFVVYIYMSVAVIVTVAIYVKLKKKPDLKKWTGVENMQKDSGF